MRRQKQRKRKRNSGETMVETLASILLIALTTAMFLNFTIAAGRLTERTKKREERFYEAVSFLEGMEENRKSAMPGILTVSIQSEHGRRNETEQFSVQVYEDEGMVSYRLTPWEELQP